MKKLILALAIIVTATAKAQHPDPELPIIDPSVPAWLRNRPSTEILYSPSGFVYYYRATPSQMKSALFRNAHYLNAALRYAKWRLVG